MKDFIMLIIFMVFVMIISRQICMKNIEKYADTPADSYVLTEENVLTTSEVVMSEELVIQENESEEVVIQENELEETNSNIEQTIVNEETNEETLNYPDLNISGGMDLVIGLSNETNINTNNTQTLDISSYSVRNKIILSDGNNNIELNEGVTYLKDLKVEWLKDATKLILTYGEDADIVMNVDNSYDISLSEPNIKTVNFSEDLVKLINVIFKVPKIVNTTSISVSPKLSSGTVIIEGKDNVGVNKREIIRYSTKSMDIPQWLLTSNKIIYKLGPYTTIKFLDEEQKEFTQTINPLLQSKVIMEDKENLSYLNKYNKVKKINLVLNENRAVINPYIKEKNIKDILTNITNLYNAGKSSSNNGVSSETSANQSNKKVWMYVAIGIFGVGLIAFMIYFFLKKRRTK